jgi:hypothetical protein
VDSFIGFIGVLSDLGVSKSLIYMNSFIGGFIGAYIRISPIKIKDSSKVERVNSLSTVAVEKALRNES